MNHAHVAYSYPSHLIPLLDLVLLVVAVLVLLLAPRWSRRRAAGAWRWLRRLARRPGRAVALVFLTAAAANGAVFLVLGAPVPRTTDEFAYLLAADTFASGRLVNPSHPMWRHFDVHSLQWPVYAVKYPPAQGLYLALGQLLTGSPAVSVCLGAAFLSAAACWAFYGWLRPPWALLGGVVVLLRLGVGSYWNQSYWGGSVAAIGGALLLGALPRLLRRPRISTGLVLAAGLVILGYSRPYEGLLVSLPVLAAVAYRGLRSPAVRRVLLPAAVVVALAFAALLFYNRHVTGDPWLLPHQAYGIAYNSKAEFVFERSSGAAFESQLRAPERAAAPRPEGPRPPWVGRALRQAPYRLGLILQTVLSLALACALLLVPLRRRSLFGIPALSCGLVVLGHGITQPWFPHYAAPMVTALFLLALAGLRRLSALRRRGRRVGRAAPLAVLAVHLVLVLVQFPGQRPDPGDWSRERQRVAEEIAALPGRHLIVVYRPRDWISNAADVDGAKVVWARDLGEDANRRLLDYFRDRTAWQLDLTRRGRPEPVPYSR